ncbi:MAG TPA: tyrosine-type recombinase/integrase [Anaerovoracaceae bacterium]|nr:tyrosine-type recombinase/integrase [Anaerovoracaceae bacterium]
MNEIMLHSQKFLKHCQNQRRLSQDTVKAYGLDLKGFMEFLQTLDPPVSDFTDVTKHTLQEYINYLNGNFAVKTVRRRIASLRSFYNYLEGEEILPDNPFDKLHLNIKEPFRIPQTMSLDEVNRILACAYGTSPTLLPVGAAAEPGWGAARKSAANPNSREFIWLRDIAILELLFAGGFRVSELCKLQFADLSADRLAIRIHGKGNKERTIYLENIEVVKALNRYLISREAVEDGNGYLFISKFDRPLSTQAVRNLVKKYSGLAGIYKKITPHVFRHSFASLLLEEGVDIKYIQDFLGHSSISTTQIYLHTTSSEKRRILSTKHPRQKLILSDIAPMADYLMK